MYFLDLLVGIFMITTKRPHDQVSELSSEAIGGQVVSVSDEFFAEASQLLLPEVRFAQVTRSTVL